MIFLDTNAVIWLYQGEVEKFSSKVKMLIEANDVVVSPLVQLELQYLLEIKRLKVSSHKILETLYSEIGLTLQNIPLSVLIEKSIHESWTRDPFDRLIVAQAKIGGAHLVTKDAIILKNYSKAIW